MTSNEITRHNGPRGGMPVTMMPLSEAVSQVFRDAFTPFGAGASMMSGLAANLYEQDNGYILQIPLPGVKQDDLSITIRENVVTLQGTIGFPVPEGARPIYQAAGGGRFREQVVLPSDVDAEQAQAQYQDGILTLTLPKAPHARERTISLGQGRLGDGRGSQSSTSGQRSTSGQGQSNTSGQAQTGSSAQGQSSTSAQGQAQTASQQRTS